MKNVDIISKVVSRKVEGNVVTPGGRDASMDLSGYLPKSEWSEIFELKTDGNGIKYLSVKKPIAAILGITIYQGGESLNLQSIFAGLPIDGTTIYWSNGILKAAGGGTSGGGSIEYALSWSGFSSGSYNGSTPQTIYIPSKLSELTNDASYAKTSDLSGYLPLSGGILDGELTIRGINSTADSWLQFSNKSDSVVHRLGIRRPETTYGLQYYNGIGYYNLYHSGNFNPSDYLPKTGGTLKGSSNTPLVLKGDVEDTWISFRGSDDTFFASLGVMSNHNLYLYTGATYTIWHSGNDGSGSGLDADLLDGVQESVFCRHFDGVHIESHRSIGYGYAEQGWIFNGPALSIGYSGENYLMQLQAPADYTALHFRNRMNGVWGYWKEIAFTDSNVASATNADKVDGYHASDIFTYEGETYTNGESSLWNSYGAKIYANALPDNLTGVYNYGQVLSFGGGNAKFDMYISHVATDPYYDHTQGGIYVRSGWSTDRKPWRKLAFTDGNVASATKLQTARTIWGQSFDGSGDVGGNLHIYTSKIFWHNDNANYYITCPLTTSSARLEYMAYGGHAFLGGNVGFGTTNPAYKLDISHSIGDMIRISSTGSTYACIIYSPNGGSSWSVGCNSNNQFYFYNSGAIKAYLDSNGNILTSGSVTMNSMRSMKNIVDERGLSLSELGRIKPTRFKWKDGRDNRIHVGGIADDVMKVLPEVVFKGSDGVLSMDYASAAFVMAASLIQPMTEHERRIANLERENALLKEEIRNLKSA